MQERIAKALERIAESLEQMQSAQIKQMETMTAQNNPEKIKEVVSTITDQLMGGFKRG